MKRPHASYRTYMPGCLFLVLLLATGGCHSMSTNGQSTGSSSPVLESSPEKPPAGSSAPLPAAALLERLDLMAAAAGPETDLEGLQLEWSDMQGLSGGTTLRVQGNGATLVATNRAGRLESQAGTTSPRQVQLLLRDLHRLGVFTARSSLRPGIPDEVRLRVSVSLGEDKLEVWRWQSDISPGQSDPIGESRLLFDKATAAAPL